MDPKRTDPTAAGEQAPASGHPAPVTINTLPDALPCKRKRRRSDTIVMSKPYQEPPWWVAVDEADRNGAVEDSQRPAQAVVVPSTVVDEAPFQFTTTAVPRKRRPIRSAIRIVVPSFVSVGCAGLIVALTLQAMNPAKPKETQPSVQVTAVAPVERPASAKPQAVVERPEAAKAPAIVEPPTVVEAIAAAKPQAAVVEPLPAVGPTIVVIEPECEKAPAMVVPPPAAAVVARAEPAKAPAADCAVCKEPGAGGTKQDTFGTSIHFVENTKVAGETAKEQKKLMLVLNISGNFEDSGFT